MKLSIALPVFAAVALSMLRVEAEERKPVVITNPPAPAATEDKPTFLYFKEGIITRKGKNKIEFDLTMADSLPSGPDRNRELVFWVKLDLDSTTKTGRAPITFPDFGQDIFCCIYKPRGTSQWKTYSDTSNITGRSETLDISKVRVSGNKVGFELSSPLLVNSRSPNASSFRERASLRTVRRPRGIPPINSLARGLRHRPRLTGRHRAPCQSRRGTMSTG